MYYTRVLLPNPKAKQSLALCCFLLMALLSSCISDDELAGSQHDRQAVAFSTEISVLGSDLEHKVNSVRLLAFNFYTQEIALNTLLEFPLGSQISLPLTLKPDRYSFVFIANENSSFLPANYASELQQVENLQQLKALSFAQQPFRLEANAQATTLPMSAYLPNEKIVGGSPDQPQLLANIYLLRAFAKLSLFFYEKKEEPTSKTVEGLRLQNICTHYSLPALPEMYQGSYLEWEEAVSFFPSPQASSRFADRKLLGTQVYYLPEQLIAQGSPGRSTQIQIWGQQLEEQTLELSSKNHEEDLPYPLQEINFMRFPIQEELALNSLVRNTHYIANILLSSAEELACTLEIADWEWKDSERDFDEAVVSGFSINGLALPEQEIDLQYGEVARIQFQVDQPVGALWKATLSNGAH
ncbi:MAG: hypothetical protein ACRC9P_03555, partial [Bacteroides sp.]